MGSIVTPGQGIIYMKVGVHARESLEDIIARKKKEINDAGFALWGYGGNTCHPSMVRNFADVMNAQNKTIYLCMQEMLSKHDEEPVRAEFFSVDGKTYQPVPKAINVLGSRFALAIKDLHHDTFELPLDDCQVAVGPSRGRIGSNYIQGRVDKACFTISDPAAMPDSEKIIPINLVAELCSPFAVYLKNS